MLEQDQQTWTPNLSFYYSEEVFINYKIIGKGTKPIIFLHGFGLSLFSWEEMLQKNFVEQEVYTFYLIDLKGFGFSYKGEKGEYSISEQAKIIESFVIKHKLNTISLVGHSYGGIVSLFLLFQTSAKPRKIVFEKLILLDTPAYEGAQPFFLKVLRNPILNFIGLKILSAKSNAKFTIRNTFHDKETGLGRYLKMYTFFLRQSGADVSMTKVAKQIYPGNINAIEKFYKSIETPTLIIWGRYDNLIPLKYGEQLARDIQNSIFKVIEDCGHVPNEERPSETADLIKEFLTK